MSNSEKDKSNSGMQLDFAKLEKLILTDLKTRPYQPQGRFIGKYTKQDIVNFILAPEVWYNQVQLRYTSKYLYNMSNHYKRTINYLAGLPNFDYVVEPYGIDPETVDVKKFRKAYMKAVDTVDSMNIKHEFRKVMNVAFREDTFFGYLFMNKSSFFIQRLDPDYCKISSLEDGVYNFAFDFTYFTAYPYRLAFYPQEFTDKWNEYRNDGIRWKELDSKNTICIKVNEDLDFPLPPFVGVLGNLLDFEDFKNLRKIKTEINNYKLVYQRIPMKQNSTEPNDYLIDYNQSLVFHKNAEAVLPEQVGLVTTPMELDVIDFERDRPDINKVSDIEAEYWGSAGISQILFSADSGSIGLDASIKTDEMISFQVVDQIERWINRFMKNLSGVYKFRVKILRTTQYNIDEVYNRYVEAATYGMPVKSYMLASMGHSQSALTTMTFLENEVLELHDNMIPMQSSHTQSNDEGGRPQKAGKDLTESGAETRNKKKNENRAKK